MFIRAAAGPSTALNYLLTTSPSPLEITPAGTTPTPATITVTAANPDPDPVRVESVKFTIVVGTGAGALTEDLEQIHLTVTPGADWTFTRDGDGSFLAVPAGDKDYVEVTDKAVLFEFTNIAVNAEIGVTTVDITEKTQDPDSEGDTDRGSAEFQVGKCYPGFQFADLHPTILDDCTASGSHGDCVTSYSNGGCVTLSWAASYGATYTMFYDNQYFDVTKVRTWTTPAPVHRDATFHLRGTITTGSNTVTHYLHANVTVNNPDLVTTSLTVDGDLNANGNVTAVGADTIVRIRDLRGPYGENLSIPSNTSFQNGITLGGGVTTGGDITVGGALTVNGNVAANGHVTAVGGDKVVRIRDLRGPVNAELTINSTVEVPPGSNVILDGSEFGQADWARLRDFINGNAKFQIWNTMYNGGGEANVFAYSDGGAHRSVEADFGSPYPSVHAGSSFRFVFE